MIRFLFLNIFIGLYTMLMCVWALLVALFDKGGGKLVHFKVAVPWARGVLRACGVKVEVRGLASVEADLPRIYMANHQSAFDIFTLLACLPVDFKFILKRELMKIPLFGPAMKRADYIAIDRGDPRKAVASINSAAERIKAGASVLIFPEGTRSADGRIQAFKKGGFHLAVKSGCDIVPITIINSRNIVQKGSMRINSGKITMSIGEPIGIKGYGKRNLEQLMARVRDSMISEMSENESIEPIPVPQDPQSGSALSG